MWIARNWIRGDYENCAICYGQFAEDILMWEALKSLGGGDEPKALRYLDIGANHPTRLSNTMFFYHRGATGLLIEPNPQLVERLRKRRPKDTVLGIGVAEKSSERLTFHKFIPDVLGTFSGEAAESYKKMGYSYLGSQPIQVVGVRELLEEHYRSGPPDIFSLDAEGLDAKIIEAIDWQVFHPKVICVETWDMGSRKVLEEIPACLRGNGYQEFARVGPNSIFKTTRG